MELTAPCFTHGIAFSGGKYVYTEAPATRHAIRPLENDRMGLTIVLKHTSLNDARNRPNHQGHGIGQNHR